MEKENLEKKFREVGGIIVAVEQLIRDLNFNNVSFEVIDLNYRNYNGKFFAFLIIQFRIFMKIWQHESIMLNGNNNVIYLYAPPIVFYNLLARKKIIFRFFAGNFIDFYLKLSHFPSLIITFLLKRADILFFEQLYQVDFFKKINRYTRWFPNLRSIDNQKNIGRERLQNHTFGAKFIFIGNIKEEKGVIDILKVKKLVGDNFDVSLFGTLGKFTPPKEYSNIFNKIYKGVLSPGDVVKTMSNYDVLILPSYREGYPGVIVEAFGAGLPVIATNLPGIREMFANSECGILIEPGDLSDLQNSVTNIFNEQNYVNFAQNALKRFEDFDSMVQMPKLINLLTK